MHYYYYCYYLYVYYGTKPQMSTAQALNTPPLSKCLFFHSSLIEHIKMNSFKILITLTVTLSSDVDIAITIQLHGK